MTGLIAAVMVHASACGNDGDDLPPPAEAPNPATTSPPEPTLDERDAAAWEEIQTKFDGFMETWIKWSAEGRPRSFEDPVTADFNEYSEFQARDHAIGQLDQETRDGQIRTGEPTWFDPRLLGIDWDRKVQDLVVPEAVFEICVDDSQWIVVDAESGEPAGVQPLGRRLWTVRAWWAEEREFGTDGWALSQLEVGGSC
ncbi:MAG TPA: hypothetical protein VIL37_15290 [Natronosporangium sp.]